MYKKGFLCECRGECCACGLSAGGSQFSPRASIIMHILDQTDSGGAVRHITCLGAERENPAVESIARGVTQ